MRIKKLSNNKLIFSGKTFSKFENNFIYFQKPNKSDTFISSTTQSEKSTQKTELASSSNILIAGLALAGVTLAYIGAKRLIKKPSKADIALTQFLDNKANEFSKLTETLKSNVKNLYEKQLVEFKKLFAVPDNKLPQNIQNTVAEINNAKSVQDLFTLEDRAVTGIYEWFKNASKQQKPASEFIEPFNNFKTNLLDNVKKLQEKAVKELEKPLDIPENLRKTKHSKQILQKFNDEILNHEKYKVERLSDYVEKLADEDAKVIFNRYNEDFDKILTTKNRALSELLKIVKNMKEKMLWGKEKPAFDGVKNCLPDSISNNKFFKFVNFGEKNSQDWINFVKNDLGKDLSYKDINILEQRLYLRNGIFVDEKTVDKFYKDKLSLFEFFKKLVTQKAPKNFNEDNMTKLEQLDFLDMANSIKNKYGDSRFFNMAKEFTNSYSFASDSLIFKMESMVIRNQLNNEKSYFSSRFIRENDYFNWEEIL